MCSKVVRILDRAFNNGDVWRLNALLLFETYELNVDQCTIFIYILESFMVTSPDAPEFVCSNIPFVISRFVAAMTEDVEVYGITDAFLLDDYYTHTVSLVVNNNLIHMPVSYISLHPYILHVRLVINDSYRLTTFLQSSFRAIKIRRSLKRKKMSAIVIQRAFRNYKDAITPTITRRLPAKTFLSNHGRYVSARKISLEVDLYELKK